MIPTNPVFPGFSSSQTVEEEIISAMQDVSEQHKTFQNLSGHLLWEVFLHMIE
jgi:hypothetical protein